MLSHLSEMLLPRGVRPRRVGRGVFVEQGDQSWRPEIPRVARLALVLVPRAGVVRDLLSRERALLDQAMFARGLLEVLNRCIKPVAPQIEQLTDEPGYPSGGLDLSGSKRGRSLGRCSAAARLRRPRGS